MKIGWVALGLAASIGIAGIVSPANANLNSADISIVVETDETEVFTEAVSIREVPNGAFNPESIDLSSLPEDYIFSPGDYQSGINLTEVNLDEFTGMHIHIDGQGQWTKRAENLYVRVLIKANNPSLGMIQWRVTHQPQQISVKNSSNHRSASNISSSARSWQIHLSEVASQLLQEPHFLVEERFANAHAVNAQTPAWNRDVQVTKRSITSLQHTGVIQPSHLMTEGNQTALKIDGFWFFCKYQCQESS